MKLQMRPKVNKRERYENVVKNSNVLKIPSGDGGWEGVYFISEKQEDVLHNTYSNTLLNNSTKCVNSFWENARFPNGLLPTPK